MASLSEFPINEVVAALQKVNDRFWDKPGKLFKEVDCALSIADARLVCAAALWIEVLITAEVKIDQDSEFNFEELYWLIKEKTHSMKLQSPHDKWLWLNRREMKMMMALETHLDRYAAKSKSESSKPKSNWKKGKKN